MRPPHSMRAFLRNHGLSITMIGMFLIFLIGQVLTGRHEHNDERRKQGESELQLGEYLRSAHFIEATAENWESEFLQMSTYVVLTGILIQRGAAESRDPDDPPRDSDLKAQARKPGAPRILMGGDLARWVYARSLGIALFVLFLLSFLLHWWNSAKVAAQEARQHGDRAPGMLGYIGDPQLWFESFQNWQSEFLSTAVLVVLSI